HDGLLIKSAFPSLSANYSRRIKSEPLPSYYKNVSEPRVKDGGPNWEIFNPKGNRFYLPNALGPVWLCKNSIFSPLNVNLEDLIDFGSKDPGKFEIYSQVCPVLIRENVLQKFPDSELRVITLSYKKHTEAEEAAKKFVIAARNICKRLSHEGHWADFINPFSGKAFHNYGIMNQINESMKFGMKYEDQNN
ncbi:Cobalamin trafficking protein CblD, partial [Pseudolycoriella hygida]